MLSDEEGTLAVRLARRAVERALHAPPTVGAGAPPEAPVPASFSERRGAFVTWRRFPTGDLRGCIGFPLPVLPFERAIIEASISAAEEDPRFPPVRATELPRLTVEVSALTVPELLRFSSPEEAVRSVTVGRDGLVVEGRGTSGLLLPQVAPEQGWDAEQLLEGTCEKAGLPPNAWKDPAIRVKRFRAEVFAEESPGGAVVRQLGELTAPEVRGARRT
ncbi:MAG TPA: TIGR00296 family protein [Thermoplasmata archaeon]|nr:TIGR00296 family protein [Thermoplasmata archaeon]